MPIIVISARSEDKDKITALDAGADDYLTCLLYTSYWSAFGQTVILLMIQIGGLGVVTVAAFFAMLSGRKISLMQRSTMQDATSAPKVGGIVRLTLSLIHI